MAKRHSHLSVNPDFLERSVDTEDQHFSVCTPECVRYTKALRHREKHSLCIVRGVLVPEGRLGIYGLDPTQKKM